MSAIFPSHAGATASLAANQSRAQRVIKNSASAIAMSESKRCAVDLLRRFCKPPEKTHPPQQEVPDGRLRLVRGVIGASVEGDDELPAERIGYNGHGGVGQAEHPIRNAITRIFSNRQCL